MKIGIAYDTPDMYNLGSMNNQYFDFADLSSIHTLKREIEMLGHQVELLGNTDRIFQSIRKGSFSCDLVYNTVEGIRSRNREGLLPALLEICQIPYIGTDAFGLSLTLDKTLTKILARHLGILTPDFYVASPNNSKATISEDLTKLNYPAILKPNFEGNSSGIVVCDSYDDANIQVFDIMEKYQTSVLCEEFILGKEITVPLIGNDLKNALIGVTAVNIQTHDHFWLDVQAKTFGDYHNVLFETSPQVLEQYKDICFRLFNAIGCQDFARFDFRMTADNKIYFIEVNPLPTLFRNGSFDIVGQQHGYTFAQTLDQIISVSCERLAIPKT